MITVENLSKKYRDFEAVRDVSFSVGRDQVLGFLGPNGAGKTTIMKILTCYHFPSGGQVRINGLSVEEEPETIKKQIGYLPENNPLYGDFTPIEYLGFMAAARSIPKTERKKALDAAIGACGLEGYRNQRIDNLSKGYRQRVGLAQAIIHDPEILILDEPTSGLDPLQIIEIRSLIRELGKRKTVILSTHILQEVEAVCSRVLILNEGRIAAQGTAEEIAGTMAGGSCDTWELCLKGASGAELEERLSASGMEISDVEVHEQSNGIIRLGFKVLNQPDGEPIFDWAVSEGYKIIEMNRRKLSLEDIFVRLTNESQSKEGRNDDDPE